jgi:hypothetical protein
MYLPIFMYLSINRSVCSPTDAHTNLRMYGTYLPTYRDNHPRTHPPTHPRTHPPTHVPSYLPTSVSTVYRSIQPQVHRGYTSCEDKQRSRPEFCEPRHRADRSSRCSHGRAQQPSSHRPRALRLQGCRLLADRHWAVASLSRRPPRRCRVVVGGRRSVLV